MVRSTPARLLTAALLVATVLGAAGAVQASASGSITPAPGALDPRKMVLTRADLGGAKVTDQGYYKDDSFPSVISYGRVLENAKFRSMRLAWVDSEAEIGTSAATTDIALSSIRKYLSTKEGRKALRELFEEEIPFASGPLGSVNVGKPRNLGVGESSFDVVVVVKMLDVRLELHLSVFRVERVLGLLGVISQPGKRVPLATLREMGKVMAARMVTELTPKSTAPPAISGIPVAGQTLTASTGTWTGQPTSYAYQWQRCDAAGAACTDIAGATAPSYLVAATDAGATLRVVVTARNSAAAGTASSAPTSVVQSAGGLVNIAPPTISGTAQVGQTLTATTGTWNGLPTSFAFQWQRCNAAGSSCVDIPGATGGTYLVTSADTGSTIRVLVTARNDQGAAAAASAPTTIVP